MQGSFFEFSSNEKRDQKPRHEQGRKKKHTAQLGGIFATYRIIIKSTMGCSLLGSPFHHYITFYLILILRPSLSSFKIGLGQPKFLSFTLIYMRPLRQGFSRFLPSSDFPLFRIKVWIKTPWFCGKTL